MHAEPVTFPFLSLVTRHLDLYASEQKVVRRKYTASLPSLGSNVLTFWRTPDFFIAVTSQCSRTQVSRDAQKYFATESRL